MKINWAGRQTISLPQEQKNIAVYFLKKCRLNIRIKQVDMEQDGTTKKCFVF
jgi:hypothetical protein